MQKERTDVPSGEQKSERTFELRCGLLRVSLSIAHHVQAYIVVDLGACSTRTASGGRAACVE